MEDPQPREGSNTSGESSVPTVQLNIKTLDSRIYSFHVNKNIVVSAFKEKIATESDVPVGQQRLIFRGKVLKDDHLLSQYNVENGDTLHLVERQPQDSPGSGSGEAASNNGGRGQDPAAGGSRNRIGHIAHSVVLGTLNVGDPGEAVAPDLGRVIGAVLNSMGIGNLAGMGQPGIQPSYGNGTEGPQANTGGQSQGGNQSVPWQTPNGQSPSPAMQIPLGAAIAIPSLNMPIPDSLNTLSVFMNRMEHAFSQNGDQPSQSPAVGSPAVELPTNALGLPTVEALNIVMRHAERLLINHTGPALNHATNHFDQDGASSDPAVRRQVQTEYMRLGGTMLHLGSLFLELGRTILTLRMGQSPAESFVNAGPAVYISPLGPNPIMVQPLPLQTSSLFGGPPGVASSPMPVGPVGVGGIPRNVNIHIHTGASLATNLSSRNPTGEGVHGELERRTDPSDSGQGRSSPEMNATATAFPPQPAVVSISGSLEPVAAVPQTGDANSISSVVAEINAQLRSLVPNFQNENNGISDSSSRRNYSGSGVGEATQIRGDGSVVDDQKAQSAYEQPSNAKEMRGVMTRNTEPSINFANDSRERPSTSESAGNLESRSRPSRADDTHDGSPNVPLGLGLGGLQPKRRGRQLKTLANISNETSANSQKQQSTAVGQKVLQSLSSLSTQGNTNRPLEQSADLSRNMPMSRQNGDGQTDVADAMSQVLRSPALDGLLAGVSQETGVGSPEMLKNMLQQFTQNPAMRNVVNQMAQQIDSHDLEGMFSGLDRGPGGGIDLSRMMQQMMPIVSQALGGGPGGPSVSHRNPPMESVIPETSMGTEMAPINNDPQQVDLRQVVQRIESHGSPEEIFSTLIGRAADLSNGDSAGRGLNELSNQDGLAQEFMEVLRRDLSRRLHDDNGS